VPVTYFTFLLTEKLWPARQFPPRRGWQWIGLGFLVLVMTISTVIVLGLFPLAAALTGYFIAFNSFFQH